jgi:hypothetical protein
VTRAQLLEIGVAPRTITQWVQSGRLITVHAGVYAVGHPEISSRARAAAAVLACGPDAVLSHDSAAALWGLRRWPPRPEVTSPGERRRPEIRTHRSHTLTRADIRRRDEIPVTSPARTITDIALRLTDQQLVRVVNEARLAGHLRATALQRLQTSCPRARRLIAPDQAPTRSEFEDLFVAFTAHHGLPRPHVNVKLHGRELDALFAPERVIVELDSWRHHQDRNAFERDRDKDADATAEGYVTVRITWQRLRDEPYREAARLRKTLERQRRVVRRRG